MKTLFERAILIYTLLFTITNLTGFTNINWLYVGAPFYIFILGPAIFSYVIKKLHNI